MDIFKLMRDWFNFCFENPEKISPNHSALYFFCIEHCNRMGWKEKFGLPTEMAKEAIGIKNYKTYKKTFDNLIEWGFIILVQKSKNQYSANIIAISKNTKAHTKALDKAAQKHILKQGEKQVQSIVGIDIQNTILQETINTVYDFYPSKCPVKNRSLGKSQKDKDKIGKLLGEHTKEDLLNRIDLYIRDCISTKSYVKNFSTFLNNLPDIQEKKMAVSAFGKSKRISYKDMEVEV